MGVCKVCEYLRGLNYNSLFYRLAYRILLWLAVLQICLGFLGKLTHRSLMPQFMGIIYDKLGDFLRGSGKRWHRLHLLAHKLVSVTVILSK